MTSPYPTIRAYLYQDKPLKKRLPNGLALAYQPGAAIHSLTASRKGKLTPADIHDVTQAFLAAMKERYGYCDDQPIGKPILPERDSQGAHDILRFRWKVWTIYLPGPINEKRQPEPESPPVGKEIQQSWL